MMGKAASGAKRVLSATPSSSRPFLNGGSGRKRVAFSSHFPGKIKPVDLQEWGGTVIAQKDSFLWRPKGTNVDIAFTKKIGAGFFGGEGFILQKITGDGVAGAARLGRDLETTLAQGETLRVDTGCIVAMEQRVRYDIKMVPGIKTALFGGEGPLLRDADRPRARAAADDAVLAARRPHHRRLPRAGGSRVQEGACSVASAARSWEGCWAAMSEAGGRVAPLLEPFDRFTALLAEARAVGPSGCRSPRRSRWAPWAPAASRPFASSCSRVSTSAASSSTPTTRAGRGASCWRSRSPRCASTGSRSSARFGSKGER
jgi:hypothetical protein